MKNVYLLFLYFFSAPEIIFKHASSFAECLLVEGAAANLARSTEPAHEAPAGLAGSDPRPHHQRPTGQRTLLRSSAPLPDPGPLKSPCLPLPIDTVCSAATSHKAIDPERTINYGKELKEKGGEKANEGTLPVRGAEPGGEGRGQLTRHRAASAVALLSFAASPHPGAALGLIEGPDLGARFVQFHSLSISRQSTGHV